MSSTRRPERPRQPETERGGEPGRRGHPSSSPSGERGMLMRERAGTIDDFVLEEGVRQAAYAGLADAFGDPGEFPADAGLFERLHRLITAVEESALAPLAERLRRAAEHSDRTALKREYTALFVGPQSLLAPPYGSVYLEPAKRRVMGDSTEEVKRLYRQAGLRVSADIKEPPDHIRLELRFMSHVVGAVIAAVNGGRWDDAQALVQTQLGFLQRHLAVWVKPFAQLVISNGTGEFYPALAELTEGFVVHDGKYAARCMYEDFARLRPSRDAG